MRKKNLSTRPGDHSTTVCILAPDPAFEDRAGLLSVRLDLPICRDPREIGRLFDLAVLLDADGLSLFDGKMTLRGDLTHMLPRLMPGKLSAELLVRAAKLKNPGPSPVAIDCTAGLGEDSLLLATMGYTVHLFEHDLITAALLDDALRKARSSDDTAILADAASRMILHSEDSLPALSALRGRPVAPDLIYLDPMFPARKKSGLITKKLQILQMLESPCAEEAALLSAAIEANPRRIVIKRPLKGPFLADVKPAYSIKGKAIRYDCIAVRG
ncbi:MAG: class I SAM-dependent methyltransferase [Lachnospiraceae bacterium]|nr:class I SAM-dependent methyltransferase [Lachnospiraceae bacterium]